jgi:phospholipase C
MRRRNAILAAMSSAALAATLVAACTSSSSSSVSPPGRPSGSQAGTYVVPAGIHKIKHVIIVMQENRSFDTYFGTFPGADGIAMRNGTPAACVPSPAGGCVRPYHDTADVNGGGPHGEVNAVADVAG